MLIDKSPYFKSLVIDSNFIEFVEKLQPKTNLSKDTLFKLFNKYRSLLELEPLTILVDNTLEEAWEDLINQQGFQNYEFGQMPEYTPATVTEDIIKGGKGDNTKDSDVNPIELEMGIAVETEHTDNLETAKEIALDHLTENPKYYSEGIEKGIFDEMVALTIYLLNKENVMLEENVIVDKIVAKLNNVYQTKKDIAIKLKTNIDQIISDAKSGDLRKKEEAKENLKNTLLDIVKIIGPALIPTGLLIRTLISSVAKTELGKKAGVERIDKILKPSISLKEVLQYKYVKVSDNCTFDKECNQGEIKNFVIGGKPNFEKVN